MLTVINFHCFLLFHHISLDILCSFLFQISIPELTERIVDSVFCIYLDIFSCKINTDSVHWSMSGWHRSFPVQSLLPCFSFQLLRWPSYLIVSYPRKHLFCSETTNWPVIWGPTLESSLHSLTSNIAEQSFARVNHGPHQTDNWSWLHQ
jgi:hypothetical protein